jgi:arylsulfatase A-like enzyme
MTGRYPCRGPFRKPYYAKSFHKGKFPLSIELRSPTFPNFMKQQGFRTAAIGKWHLGYGVTEEDYEGVMTPGPVDIGFDVHFGVPGNHNDRFERYVIGDSIYRPLSVEPGPARLDDPSRPAQPFKRIDDLVDTTLTDRAREFIKESADRSFFLYLTYCATHTHITPRVDFRGRSRIGQLGDYMMELDHHVGEIEETLKRNGLAENTLLIFTSDNGGQENDVKGAGTSLELADASGDVALKAQTAKRTARTKHNHLTNGPLRGYKGGIHEGGFRVPCIARWPAHIKAGTETEALFSLVDLYATIATLVKQDPGFCGEDSISQSNVLLGSSDSPPRKRVVLNAPNGRLALRSGDWKMLTTKPVRWERGIPSLDNLKSELYDLSIDPYEQSDLASSQPQVLHRLKQELITEILNGRSVQD